MATQRTFSLPPLQSRPRLAGAAFLLLVATLLGLLLPRLLETVPERVANWSALGVIALAVLVFLGLARPATLFAIAFGLLAVVRVEPAPVDLAFFLLIVVTVIRMRRRSVQVPAIALVPLLFYAPLSVISMVNAVDWHRAVRFEMITLYLLALALTLPTMFELWGVAVPIKSYIIAAALSAAMGILALQTHFPGAHLLIYQGSRVQAFFKDPNVYGPFLVPGVVILLEELARPRLLNWRTRTCALLASVLAVGVVFSYSRAALLNLAVAVIVVAGIYFWRRGGNRFAQRILVAVAVAAIVGFALLLATGSLTFLEARSHLQAYDQNRFATQDAGFREASIHTFGFGPGQADAVLSLATHSTFARAAFEQGFLGLALIIALVLATTARGMALVAGDADLRGLGSAAVFGAWVGVVANSFFIDTLHWRHLWVVAALVWAMPLAEAGSKSEAEGPSRRAAEPWRAPRPARAPAGFAQPRLSRSRP